ncbi:MAG: response regulator [Magnetococcales bacterium]|nr:response regulator [Magnetococcales bacterium]
MNDALEASKILIVDDVRENVDVLRDILAGYVRMVALNGAQALKIAQSNHPPDLILLDIMMPDMDGYEVCRQLKTDAGTADIPVIFLTAKNSVPDESLGFALGAVDYITKPISPPLVLARVKTHLQLQRTLATLKSQHATIQQQYQELAAASKLREDVKYLMQQDLKTPLNEIISGVNQLYMNGRPGDQEAKSFYSVLKSTNQLLTMINVSIEMYKIEQGNYQLNPQPINLMPVLSDVVKFEQHRLDLKGLTVKLLLNGRTPQVGERFFVFGEELLCYSMFTNLLQNAIEASVEQKEIIIFLEGNDPSIIKMSYQDKLPVVDQERFFVKYIADGDYKRYGPYAAKMIAEIQNGSIALKTSGHGVTVMVGLPTGWLEGVNLHR